jgi:hypothetical protein
MNSSKHVLAMVIISTHWTLQYTYAVEAALLNKLRINLFLVIRIVAGTKGPRSDLHNFKDADVTCYIFRSYP